MVCLTHSLRDVFWAAGLLTNVGLSTNAQVKQLLASVPTKLPGHLSAHLSTHQPIHPIDPLPDCPATSSFFHLSSRLPAHPHPCPHTHLPASMRHQHGSFHIVFYMVVVTFGANLPLAKTLKSCFLPLANKLQSDSLPLAKNCSSQDRPQAIA